MKIRTGDLTFVCEDPYEVARAESLYTKEPGTIAWLRATLRPGDVFYDIGANIGCYSLVAARLVGLTGRVYAFEPHVFNAAALLRNIRANDLAAVISVVTTPLDDVSTVRQFHYTSLRPGSSGHQLGHTVSETGRPFTPAISVFAQSLRLDDLQGLRPPTVVKIDVDGLELAILRGMAWPWPRSLQVEVHAKDRHAIAAYLAGQGYTVSGRHYTQLGQQAVDRGADPDSVTDNAIFSQGVA